MAKAIINPESPDGAYRLEFEDEKEFAYWRRAQTAKQTRWRNKRRAWMEEIGWPWPGEAEVVEDLDPPPGTLEMEDPENG